jgi:hypothetical protein
MAFEIFEMATLFHQRPSDVAILDDCVNQVGRFWFNRGIATFGRAVQTMVDKAAESSNPAIARTQRQREWERLMGGDMTTSATGFADPAESSSPHARIAGRDDTDDDNMIVDGNYW